MKLQHQKFKLVLIVLLAALSVFVAFSTSAAEPEYLRWVGGADEAIAKGDYKRAQECYRAAMRLEPDNPNNFLLLANLGMVQHYAGEDSLALTTLTQAHTIAPKSVTVLANRGQVLYALGQLDAAAGDFSQVLDLDSVNSMALFNRGCIRLQKGQYKDAESDLTKAAELRPKDMSVVAAIATLYTATGRMKDALPLYDKLIDDYKDPDLYATRAMCKLVLGDLTEGAADIAEGMKLDPENGELYFSRAYLNHLRYLEDDARADARKAESLGIQPERIAAIFAK